MKRRLITIAILVLAAFVLAILPALQRAKSHSGPTIGGNLRQIQLAKDQWLAEGHTNEWPTVQDIFPGTPKGRSLQDLMRPRRAEIYFINRTGAPPFVYTPKQSGQHGGGEILVLTEQGFITVQQ